MDQISRMMTLERYFGQPKFCGFLSTEKNIIHEICEIQSGRKFIYLMEFGTTLQHDCSSQTKL